jgi:hypothetical protein
MCLMEDGAVSMLALLGLQQLQDLELVQVSGFGLTELYPRALEEAIAGLTNLRRLHVSAAAYQSAWKPERPALCLAPSRPPYLPSHQCAG